MRRKCSREGCEIGQNKSLKIPCPDTEEFADIRHVLGAIVLAFNPLSRRELSILLGIPISLISTTLRHLHSVILVPSDETKKISIIHKSFPDFLQDYK